MIFFLPTTLRTQFFSRAERSSAPRLLDTTLLQVEELPTCLVQVARSLQARGFLRPAPSQMTAGDTAPATRVVAATVDFFRKGSYTPALAATAPLLGAEFSSASVADTAAAAAAAAATPMSVRGQSGDTQGTSSGSRSARGGDKSGGKAALGLEGESDTEAVVCMLWLQVRSSLRWVWCYIASFL